MNMYAPQSSINPSLAALLQTAKMVTPDGDDTVAAQVAQAAQQKMQPQGIMQGMSQAKQYYAAAAPSVMQNMKQQEMRQMVKQAMQPQPAGIEGLPAPNMQGMADGGVVGYSGKEGSEVKTQAEEDREKIAAALRAIRDEALLPAGAAMADVATAIPRGLAGAYNSTVVRAMRAAGLPAGYLPDPTGGDFSSATPFYDRMVRGQAEAPKAAPAAQAPQVTPPAPTMSPEAQALTQRQGPRGQPSAPAPRPEGRPAAERAPAAGIAQLVEPTQDRSKVDPAGASFLEEAKKQAAALRKIAADREAAIKGMPDLNEQGIAALKRAEEERRRLLGIEQSDDSRRRWAGIFRGWGGDRDAYDRILTGIATRDAAANQAQLNFDQAQLKLREAQQAKALGQFDRAKALELEVAELYDKANKSKLQEQQIEATLASNKYATDASIYNTKVTDAAKTADRIQQAKIEGERLKQQAELNGQTRLANQINAANITVSSAIEKMDRDLDKRFGTSIKMFQLMPPEELQKNPALAASYQQYQRERDNIYKTSVEPAINHRNRLAAMVSGGQDLSKWGEPQVKTGR
jgi:hypothetical protein